jgi:PIN domain nuclease of toxin-antitoxin system
VRVLLDTHTLIWAVMQPAKLPKKVGELMQNPSTQSFFSSVSLYEISLKYHSGKWDDVAEFATEKTSIKILSDFGAIELPIYSSHARLAGALPNDHKDPFDRLIAAQAIFEQLVLLSADPLMDGFGVQRLWD